MWLADKLWADRFMHDIKGILGQNLIGEAPVEEDQEHNTDLIVLRMEPLRIACRVRRFEHFQAYKTEFTIRSSRPSGKTTELDKIKEGWGDFMFYGFSTKDMTSLYAWRLIDLQAFRRWLKEYAIRHNGNVPGRLRRNRDWSSCFRAFSILEVDDGVVKAWHIPIHVGALQA